jgi:gas vesicle protein
MTDTNNGSANGSAVRNLCIAFAAGAAVGAGVALLYAPKTGKETRELLARKTRALKDAAAGAIGRARQQARETMNQDQEDARVRDEAGTRST